MNTTTPMNLTPFCLPVTDLERPILHAPSTHDGFTYATDGRILVRVPALPDVPTRRGYPNTQSMDGIILNSFSNSRHFIRPPAAWATLTPPPCPHCSGSQADAGDPAAPCPHCLDGRAWLHPTPLDGYPVQIAWGIASRIVTLPGVLIGVPTHRNHTIPLVFDGGLGVFMPLRQ